MSEKVYKAILQAEVGVRNFTIVRNPDFHQQYIQNRDDAYRYAENLKEMVSDNPAQLANAKDLKRFLDNRLLRFDTTMNMAKANMESLEYFQRRIMLPESLSASTLVRNKLDEMVRIEKRLLTSREKELFTNMKMLGPLLLVLLAISILISMVNLYGLNMFDKSRKKYDEQIDHYQRELQEQIKSLNMSNRELEQFAYVASHDLQEPLRKIIAFSELLEENMKGKLEGENKLYLERITNSAGRMRVLINDLLNFSRASRNTNESENVSLNKVLQNVREDLSIKIAEMNATLSVGNLPEVQGTYSEMQQVFQNLVSNALKFSKKEVRPEIVIQSILAPHAMVKQFPELDPLAKYHCITVTDNGIGIEEAFYDKIFVIFQRLHSKEAYDGTGIGLAVCKKIIEKHGGKIFLSSQKGLGTTFTILLEVP